MKVDALTPEEYWRTSARDYEMAVTVQNAYHEGRAEAAEAHRTQVEREKERKQRERESLERLRRGQ
jgi:hypothetical protein